ncbi:hypothetical protein MBLNU13_g04211t2 [Cladosporium sp. NU13]
MTFTYTNIEHLCEQTDIQDEDLFIMPGMGVGREDRCYSSHPQLEAQHRDASSYLSRNQSTQRSSHLQTSKRDWTQRGSALLQESALRGWKGYGSCEIIRPTTCGQNSGTTGGRAVGYYLASNVRERACNRIYPSQIDKDKYTHLYFSFAFIDESSFHIKPAAEADAALMREFTGLKSNKLQTWIAVGGYDFSDKGKTHTTWSDMCSSQSSRAVFIQSTISFMDEYGFQGLDLDWEYPVSPDRGGKLADTANLVLLVKELRQAYGTKYGLSLTLAPDYWYLRYFDAKAMEPYVDYFGFMAYDLHGSWDTDVHTLGSIVRGQADVREINNDTLPLTYAGLDHSKINFGLAWYGRGYTLTDASCNDLGCAFSGPSKPGKCTKSAGVMSLIEIKQLIKEKGITPRLNEQSMMKELVWDDQWIGYDDEETHELKRKFANNLCFGGTMAWSVDFYAGNDEMGSDAPVARTAHAAPRADGVVVLLLIADLDVLAASAPKVANRRTALVVPLLVNSIAETGLRALVAPLRDTAVTLRHIAVKVASPAVPLLMGDVVKTTTSALAKGGLAVHVAA